MAKTKLLFSLLAMVLPFVTAQTQTLTVAADGGNSSSPLLYGTLYEVGHREHQLAASIISTSTSLTLPGRTFTTPEMAACTLSSFEIVPSKVRLRVGRPA